MSSLWMNRKNKIDRLGLPHDPGDDPVHRPGSVRGHDVGIGSGRPPGVGVHDGDPRGLQPVARNEVAHQEPADGGVAGREGPDDHHLGVDEGGAHERGQRGGLDEADQALQARGQLLAVGRRAGPRI